MRLVVDGRRFLIGILATAVLMAASGVSHAGWITLRNDTKMELAIQEATVVNGKVVLGRVTKLLPGEAIKELKQTAGSKTIIIGDAAKPNAIIARGTLEWKRDDIVFSIKSDGTTTTISVAK